MEKWKIAGEVIVGLSHRATNTLCQDKTKFDIDPKTGVIAAAVADGVGSLQYSHIAARIATTSAVDWLKQSAAALFDGCGEDKAQEYSRFQPFIAELLERIRYDIGQQAQLQGLDMKSLDCNLAFILVDPERCQSVVGQLGDCAVCVICDDSEERISRVITDRGGLANSTCTVFSSNAQERLQMGTIPLDNEKIKGFILTSDGMEGVLYRKNSRYVCKQAEYCFNELYDDAGENNLRIMLETAQKNSGGYLDDDISVIVLSRATEPIHFPEDPYWTCACGMRNSVAGTRCVECGRELMQVYQDVDFSAYDSLDEYFEQENKMDRKLEAMLQQETVEREQSAPQKDKAEDAVTDGDLSGGTVAHHQDGRESVNSRKSAAMMRGAERRIVRPEREPANLDAMGKKVPKSRMHEEEIQNDTISRQSGKTKARKKAQDTEEREYALRDILKKALPIILTIAMLIALLMTFDHLDMIGLLRGKPDDQTEPSNVIEPSDNHSDPVIGTDTPQFPEEIGLQLEDGSVYIGQHAHGVPHGYGTLISGDCVWTGWFEAGIKTGDFAVTEKTDAGIRTSIVTYEDGEIVAPPPESTPEENDEPVYRVSRTERLRYAPGYESDWIIKLEVGERVELTGMRQDNVDGENWIEIRTESGVTGWCTEQSVSENKSVNLPGDESFSG